MNRRVVLVDFETKEARLLLEHVKPVAAGTPPVEGDVVNGQWHWSVKDGREQARDDYGVLVQSSPARRYIVVEVPPNISSSCSSCSDIMRWAESAVSGK